jgi:hypothetical protein
MMTQPLSLAALWRRGFAADVRHIGAGETEWTRRFVTATRKNIKVWSTPECGTRGADALIHLKIKAITYVDRTQRVEGLVLGLLPIGVDIMVAVDGGSTAQQRAATVEWEQALEQLLKLVGSSATIAPPPPPPTPPPPPPLPPSASEVAPAALPSDVGPPAAAAAAVAPATATLSAAYEGFVPLLSVRPRSADDAEVKDSAAYARIEGTMLLVRGVRASTPPGIFAAHTAAIALRAFDLSSASAIDTTSTSVVVEWRGGASGAGGESLELRAASTTDALRWCDALRSARVRGAAGTAAPSAGNFAAPSALASDDLSVTRARCAALQTQCDWLEAQRELESGWLVEERQLVATLRYRATQAERALREVEAEDDRIRARRSVTEQRVQGQLVAITKDRDEWRTFAEALTHHTKTSVDTPDCSTARGSVSVSGDFGTHLAHAEQVKERDAELVRRLRSENEALRAELQHEKARAKLSQQQRTREEREWERERAVHEEHARVRELVPSKEPRRATEDASEKRVESEVVVVAEEMAVSAAAEELEVSDSNEELAMLRALLARGGADVEGAAAAAADNDDAVQLAALSDASSIMAFLDGDMERGGGGGALEGEGGDDDAAFAKAMQSIQLMEKQLVTLKTPTAR